MALVFPQEVTLYQTGDVPEGASVSACIFPFLTMITETTVQQLLGCRRCLLLYIRGRRRPGRRWHIPRSSQGRLQRTGELRWIHSSQRNLHLVRLRRDRNDSILLPTPMCRIRQTRAPRSDNPILIRRRRCSRQRRRLHRSRRHREQRHFGSFQPFIPCWLSLCNIRRCDAGQGKGLGYSTRRGGRIGDYRRRRILQCLYHPEISSCGPKDLFRRAWPPIWRRPLQPLRRITWLSRCCRQRR